MPSEDPRFWDLLLEKYPSLYHRYFSSDRVKTNLNLNERLVHAFTAFELFRSRFEEPVLVEHGGKLVSPNENFADYLATGRYPEFAIIKDRYSEGRLNSIQSIEEARTIQPEQMVLNLDNRVPPGTIINDADIITERVRNSFSEIFCKKLKVMESTLPPSRRLTRSAGRK